MHLSTELEGIALVVQSGLEKPSLTWPNGFEKSETKLYLFRPHYVDVGVQDPLSHMLQVGMNAMQPDE